MAAFVWKNRLFSQIADSRQCLWFMLLRASRAEPSRGLGEERNRDTKLSSFKGVLCVCCGHHTGPGCSDVSTNTLIMLYRKKWGWRCKTTRQQEDRVSDVFRTVMMKLLWLGAVSEMSEKISTLKYYLSFFHQLMTIFAESERANSMTLIMNVNFKKE